MSEGSEDTGQISVAELLARNGQQVESRGGRRRRGVSGGGISVAELTGEIPVIRAVEDSRHTIPEVPEVPVVPPAAVVAPAAVAPPAPAAVDVQPALARTRRADRSPVQPVVARYTDPQAERPTAAPVPEPPKVEIPKVEMPKAETPKARPETSMRAPLAEQPKTAAMPVAGVTPAPRPGFVPYTPIREPGLLSGSTVEGDLMRQARAAGTARRETLDEARALVHVTGEIPRIVVPKTSAFRAPAVKEPTFTPSEPEGSSREAAVLRSSASGEPEDLAPGGQVADANETTDRTDRQAAREWAVLIGQAVVALLVGALLFKGFEKLWDVLPWVALVLAVLVIAGLVAVVRILRQTDDMMSLLIAIIVGVFVTIGPLAFLLTT